MNKIVKLLILVFVFFSSAQAAELAFVNSKKIKLYEQANYKSDFITQLKKGDELEIIKKKNKWVEVKHAALKGWVPAYSISKNKPKIEKLSFFNRLKSFFMGENKRARTSTISTAGGIRGLAEGEEDSSGKKDYESLKKMEKMTVTDEEVEQFVEENKN